MDKIILPYINWIFLFLAGLLILYIKTLVSERAKNKMLKKYQSELEKVKFEHQKELDKLKSEHDLYISKRKHQYENKHSVYMSFYNYLDESSFKTKDYFEKSAAINERFLKNFLNASASSNMKMENNAMTVFQKELTHVMMEAQEGFIKLKNISNTIELIASTKVRDELKEYITANEELIDLTNKIVRLLPNFIMTKNQDKIKEMQIDIDEFSKYIKYKMILLKEAMREELEYS